jgi:predicted acetyltransferase
MRNDFSITEIAEPQKPQLWEMWVAFSIEWNADWHGLRTEKSEFDAPEVKQKFESYWEMPEFKRFFLKIGNAVAGYAVTKSGKDSHEIFEFYLKLEFRGGDTALVFAREIVKMSAGDWTVSTLTANLRAVKFWQKLYDSSDAIKTWATEKRTYWKFR